MDRQRPKPDDVTPETLSTRLRQHLRHVDERQTAASVAPETDHAVLEDARRYFAARAGAASGEMGSVRSGEAGGTGPFGGGEPRRYSRALRRSLFSARRRRHVDRRAAGLAAAALVAVLLVVVRGVDWPMGYQADDVDRSGRVDILDAFALARMRAAGEPVSNAEIDALAARIVSLDRAGGSP